MTKTHCERCGANLALVGRAHRCVPRSRGGADSGSAKAGNKPGATPGAEKGRSASGLVRDVEGVVPPSTTRRSDARPASAKGKGRGLEAARLKQGGGEPAETPVCTAPSPEPLSDLERWANVINKSGRSSMAEQRPSKPKTTSSILAGRSKAHTAAKRLGTRGPAPGTGGRPRKGEEAKTLRAQKPWEREGISQRTWYRRQQKEKR